MGVPKKKEINRQNRLVSEFNMVRIVSKNKVTRNVVTYIKTKQKISMAKKLFKSGQIDAYEYGEYVKKALKEKELLRRNVEEYTEVLFETDDCAIVSMFDGKKIEYYIDQHGLRNRCIDINDAIEKFVILTL